MEWTTKSILLWVSILVRLLHINKISLSTVTYYVAICNLIVGREEIEILTGMFSSINEINLIPMCLVGLNFINFLI